MGSDLRLQRVTGGQGSDGGVNRISARATAGKAEEHVFKSGPNMAVPHGRGGGLDGDGFAPEHGGMVKQTLLERGRTIAGQQQCGPGAGHGHVVEAALCVRFLPSSARVPPAIQHGHVVELQAFGLVGGHQQQTLLPLAHIPAPLRQPFDAVIHRGLPAAGLQLVVVDGLPQQVVPGTRWLVCNPGSQRIAIHYRGYAVA